MSKVCVLVPMNIGASVEIYSDEEKDFKGLIFLANEGVFSSISYMGLKSSCGNFLNFTNNQLESINGKLKQVISRHSSSEYSLHIFL